MAGSNQVNQCAVDLQDRLNSIAIGSSGQVFYVYDQETLLDLSKELRLPAVGIAYIGMRSTGEQGGGQGTELVFDVYVLGAGKCEAKITGQDTVQGTTTGLLDDIRNAIKCGRAPTGHGWGFVMEAPADSGRGLLYVQRWRTRCMLTS